MTTKEQTTQTSAPLIVERTFDAPVALLWKALTDVDDMRRWYFDLPAFHAVPGFEFNFTVEHEGMTYRHLCKVTEALEGRKLAYTWRYDGHPGDSLVTFELFPEGAKTRVKLTHSGLETFPPVASFARTNFERGWTSLLGPSLEQFVDEASREILVRRDFNAPRELVWEAMTNPKHVVNWWGPRGFTTTIETMDFQVGGVWKHMMHGPDGANYPNKSIFKEIVKPERVVYSHSGGREDGHGASFVATWTFEATAPEKTRVTLRLLFPTSDQRDFVAKEFGAVEGGRQTLERLSEHLARQLTEPFVISREFDAPRALVWQVCTQPDHLRHWFGAKGSVGVVSRLDFRPGGLYHYSLRFPDGRELWGRFLYREIVEPERLVFINSFSDKDGGICRNPWNPNWPLQLLSTFTFTENNGKTTLTVQWSPYEAVETERQAFNDNGARGGMMQGWGGTLDQLTEYLAKLQQS